MKQQMERAQRENAPTVGGKSDIPREGKFERNKGKHNTKIPEHEKDICNTTATHNKYLQYLKHTN
jgi:predicted NACHT family NTPase